MQQSTTGIVGLEPATHRLTADGSNQLSYTPVGCLLLTSFTLSALGYADYTKYRRIIYLFVLQICGYLRFVPIRYKAVCRDRTCLSQLTTA